MRWIPDDIGYNTATRCFRVSLSNNGRANAERQKAGRKGNHEGREIFHSAVSTMFVTNQSEGW